MVRNKWLAGAGTKALTPDMIASLCLEESVSESAGSSDSESFFKQNATQVQKVDDVWEVEKSQTISANQDLGDLQKNEEDFTCEKTLVCIDTQTLTHPQALGFSAKEHLEMPFVCLESFSNGARAAFGNSAITGALVYATDDMTGLNVAEALKRDCAQKRVVLVADVNDAWLSRRAACARIDDIVSPKEFYKALLMRHIKAPCDELKDKACGPVGNSSNAFSKEVVETCSSDDVSHAVSKENRREALSVLPLSEDDTVPLEIYAADADSYDLARAGEFDDTGEVDASEIELEECNVTNVTSCSVSDVRPHFEQPIASGEKRAFYIPVIGASGGVGKSTIAYLCALCAARLGCKTLLIDFDLQFGDMGTYSTSEQAVSFNQLADDPKRIVSLEPAPDGFCLVAACDLPEQSEEIAEKTPQVLLEASCCFDVIVSNGPASWDEQHMALLEQASKIFFVLDQRMSSVKAAQKAFDLCMRCGMAASPFLFLLNKSSRQSQLSYLDVTCAMKGSICKELPDVGRVVGEYFESGQAVSLLDEKNEFACTLYDIMADVLPGCSASKDVGRSGKMPRFLFGRKKHKEESACR